MKETILIILFLSLIIKSQSQSYANPIIKGFNPDPSICRVDSTFFLVTSSFEYFPGIPIFKSIDLVNWELTGHVWNRNSQLKLEGYKPSDGLYAPTIRYHEGKLFVVVSLVQRNPRSIKNLLFISDSLIFKWTKPIILTDSSLWGIDPSLFFDDDGKCYFTANRKHQISQPYSEYREIALQELDLETYQLKGNIDVLTTGFVKDATTAEAPHIYKKDGKYFLIIAEGGTGINHAITMGVSSNIRGPYMSCPYNPILTHRHMQNTISLRNIGHADLVQTKDNQYWMVCLGVRYFNNQSFIGRESFLVPVNWENTLFPVINPGFATVQMNYSLNNSLIKQKAENIFRDDFNEDKLNLAWTTLRYKPSFIETNSNGYLSLKIQKSTISEFTCPAFIGKRIESDSFESSMKLKVDKLENKSEAGIILLADNDNHIKFVITKNKVIITEVLKGKSTTIEAMNFPLKEFTYFKVRSLAQKFSFYISNDGENWSIVNKDFFPKSLFNFTFTGSFIGIYATSKNDNVDETVFIDWFEYKNL